MSIVKNKNLTNSSERKPSTSAGIRYSLPKDYAERRITSNSNGMRRTQKPFKAPSSMKCKNLLASCLDYGGVDINKTRPRTIRRDKYALYDDVIKLKLANNILTCENVQMKTKIKRLERELEDKDNKIICKIK